METLKKPEVRPAKQMATEEAVNVAREVYNRSPFVLDADSYDALIGMVVRFCDFEWDVNRILFQEEPLRAELLCPDGEVRTLKGAPISSTRTRRTARSSTTGRRASASRSRPASVRMRARRSRASSTCPTSASSSGRSTGCWCSRRCPRSGYVVLWEVPMRFPKYGPRYARLDRGQLEHVEARIAAQMMKLDRGLREGPGSGVWEPKPGSQCQHCEVARSCPVPPQMRGVGAVESQTAADIEARRFVRGRAMYQQAAERLKARQEAGLPPGRVNGREEARWGPEVDAWRERGGGRKFDVFPAETTSGERGEAA
jgi:hypothetical protein